MSRSGAHAVPRLLGSAAVALGLAALLAGCGGEPSADGSAAAQTGTSTGARPAPVVRAQAFASRPDLHPTEVTFSKTETASGLGDVFTAPKSSTGKDLPLSGPMIISGSGQLVWFKPVTGGVYDFRPQTYEGKPVLTWWQGQHQRGFGTGEHVIYDQHYRQIATVKGGGGAPVDFHEFKITPQNTALLILYKPISADLTGLKNGTKDDTIVDNVVQEVDIKTGKVLVQWDTAENVDPSESYASNPADPKLAYDYVHINSVDIDTDGNLIASGRGTHTYYKINRKTGETMWRMGGKKSDFTMGPGARTAFQHDVQRINASQLTAFDNTVQAPAPIDSHQTRGVVLDVDEDARTVTLSRAIEHPGTPVQAPSQGNMQTLSNGDVFFGWGGSVPLFTQVDEDDQIVLEGKYASGSVDSYRAYRAPWVGQPTTRPAAVATAVGGKTRVSVSWNGATEVKEWRISTGPSAGRLTPFVAVPSGGFETTATVASAQPLVQVEALNGAGVVIGASPVVRVSR